MSYNPPEHKKNAYDCPHCQAYARQYHHQLHTYVNGISEVKGLWISHCEHCREKSIWLDGKMLWPGDSLASLPHEAMPENCVADYMEARDIIARSPRGAAALLRLVVQKLMPHLGQKGKNIDDDIAALVKSGLPAQVQQALDSCRVIGNESVHPGEMNVGDEPEIAVQLCELINFIVDNQIAQPKRIEAIYAKIPAKKQEAIKRRDA